MIAHQGFRGRLDAIDGPSLVRVATALLGGCAVALGLRGFHAHRAAPRIALVGAGAIAIARALVGPMLRVHRVPRAPATLAAAGPPAFRDRIEVAVRVNGREHRAVVDPRVSLLDFLRENLQLTGTKKGCDAGECGACTVHLDGRRVNACMVLAAAVDGREVTTIEGLTLDGELHPVQQAFIEQDALQCGFCTPGQIMSAVALLAEGHAGSDAEIREWMSGNLCRCAAYPQIVAAVRTVARRTI